MKLYYSDFHPDFYFRFSQDFWARKERNYFFYSSQYFRIDFFMIFRLDFKIYTKIKIKSTIKYQEEIFKEISVASSFRNQEIIFWKNPGKNLFFCVWLIHRTHVKFCFPQNNLLRFGKKCRDFLPVSEKWIIFVSKLMISR